MLYSVLLIGTTACTAFLAFASTPSIAQHVKASQGTAADMGVMEVFIPDAVKLNYGFQGALQGAGTPNQAGLGVFIPLKVNQNSVWFMDALVNANFGDYNNYSSIGHTTVATTTISTSTRLGYRWLNGNRSWMYGINAGYDSRPLATGGTTNGVAITGSQTVFFNQVAMNFEATSNRWNASVYGLIPVGRFGMGGGKVATINSAYGADPLSTLGIDIGYNLFPALKLSVGYYYQAANKEPPVYPHWADGSGIKTDLVYDISQQLQVGVVYSYDNSFQSRVSGNLKWRFNGSSNAKKLQQPVFRVIQALTTTPQHRDVRVANSVCAYNRGFHINPVCLQGNNAVGLLGGYGGPCASNPVFPFTPRCERADRQ